MGLSTGHLTRDRERGSEGGIHYIGCEGIYAECVARIVCVGRCMGIDRDSVLANECVCGGEEEL